MAKKMARLRLDPEVIEECATRNGWSFLEASAEAPGWPPLVVVREALNARNYWLETSLQCCYDLPAPDLDPEPSPTPEPPLLIPSTRNPPTRRTRTPFGYSAPKTRLTT